MAAWNLPAEVVSWVAQLASVLHRRVAWRLLPLLAGALFAQGRQTVASWLRGGELGDDFRLYYYFLGSLGRNVKAVGGVLFRIAVRKIVPGDRLLLALTVAMTNLIAGPLTASVKVSGVSNGTPVQVATVKPVITVTTTNPQLAAAPPGRKDDAHEDHDRCYFEPGGRKKGEMQPGLRGDERFPDRTHKDPRQHHEAARIRQAGMSQIGMFESWEGLISETHDEQADPTENLRMAVRVDLVQPHGSEPLRRGDTQQQVRSPDRPQRQRNRDARKEERPINAIPHPRRDLRGLLRVTKSRLQFTEQPRQRYVVGAGEKGKRLHRSQFAATSAQAITIQHRPHLRRDTQQIGNHRLGL
jgi:hypothetical protein